MPETGVTTDAATAMSAALETGERLYVLDYPPGQPTFVPDSKPFYAVAKSPQSAAAAICRHLTGAEPRLVTTREQNAMLRQLVTKK